MKARPLLALLCLALTGAAFTPLSAATQEAADETAEDPREIFIARQAKRISRHPYFSKVAFDRVSPKDGYVFFIQKNPAAAPGLAERTANEMLPWLEELEALFIERCVVPAGLKRARGGAPHVIFVLTSSGDYFNCLSSNKEACPDYGGANYDPFLGVLVTFDKNFARKFGPGEKRRSQRHAFVHSLQQAWGVSTIRLPGPEWFVEGQAVYLAMAAGAEGAESQATRVDPAFLERVVKTQQAGGPQARALQPIKQLVAPNRRNAFREHFTRDQKDYWRTLLTVSAQCGLLVAFLNEVDDGALRGAFATYSEAAMTGGGLGIVAAHAAFGDLDELDRRFWEYLFTEYKKQNPAFIRKKPAFIREKTVVVDPTAGTPATSGAPAAAVVVSFSPTVLALKPSETRALLGVALWDARQGRLSAALEQLDVLAAQSDNGRVAVERGRVAGLLAERDAYLQHLLDTGSKLRLEVDGKKLNAVVTGLAEGVLSLAKNRRGVEQLTVNEIELVELCGLMAREKPKFGDPLAQAYALVLAGDDRLAKKLKRIGDDGELARDADTLLEHIAVGGVAQHVRALASTPLEGLDAESAATVVEHIAAVAPYANDMPMISDREEDLRTLATLACGVMAKSRTIEKLLACGVERLGGGRIRLDYDFSRMTGLDGFVRDDEYPKRYHERLGELGIPEGQSFCNVQDGSFTAYGASTWRLPVAIRAPQRIEFVLRYEEGPKISSKEYFAVMVGLCDDGNESYLSCFNFGGLAAFDRESGYRAEKDANQGNLMYLKVDYRVTLVHDGTKLTWALDGTVGSEVLCGPLVSGEVFLLFHTNFVAKIKSLTIEGTLAGGGADHLRELWVDERVGLLFP